MIISLLSHLKSRRTNGSLKSHRMDRARQAFFHDASNYNNSLIRWFEFESFCRKASSSTLAETEREDQTRYNCWVELVNWWFLSTKRGAQLQFITIDSQELPTNHIPSGEALINDILINSLLFELFHLNTRQIIRTQLPGMCYTESVHVVERARVTDINIISHHMNNHRRREEIISTHHELS